MKFIDPPFKELYNTLKNNNKLENFLIKNGVLNNVTDYYENYGYNEANKDVANRVIEEVNNETYERITKVFLENLDYIKENSISYLVYKRFLATELRDAIGFDNDIILSNDILWEFFYEIKYCYVSSFFQNNWENFIPINDYEAINDNEMLNSFMDSIMKEFDKLNNILSNTKKFKKYREIPYDYIVYLTQLLGVEPKDFMITNEQKSKYIELASNIIDIYSLKGTAGSFELLFNFLGYNLELKEYYFDRRRYFSISDTNEETATSDKESYKFYLTTKDPRYNYIAGLSTNETVTDIDMSDKLNINSFDELVRKYGIMCVLGYDDYYEIKDKNKPHTNNIKKYEEGVYKYFKTNYIKIKPSLKYLTGNFTQSQLYQLSAILKFLVPEFVQREMYVYVDIGEDAEEMVVNWTKDYNLDSFYMLDSESWNQNFSNKFITNYDDYVYNFYNDAPYVLNDNGTKKEYINSIGKSKHYANGKYNNVFFNPISEKIKIFNLTKYWGDKIKCTDKNAKLYPVYRINEKYVYEGENYVNPVFKKNGKQVTELYLPYDIEKLGKKEANRWEKLEQVDLYGFSTKSLKNKIREMVYGINSYFDYSKSSFGRTDVKWVIDEGINDFLDTTTNKDEWSEVKKNFFKTKWKKVDNYTWKPKFETNVSIDFIKAFTDKHKNVINYDYVNKKLFCFNAFVNIGFNDDKNSFSIKNDRYFDESQNKVATDLVNYTNSQECYYIALNKTYDKFIIYQYSLISNYKKLHIKKYTPLPSKQVGEQVYTYTTYKELLNSIDINNNSFEYNGNNYDLTKQSKYSFYVINDKCYYKIYNVTSSIKKILHVGETNINSGLISLKEINKEKTISDDKIGSFYYEEPNVEIDLSDISEDPSNETIDGIYEKLTEIRTPKIYKKEYENINKGDLIYSKKDEKLYIIYNNAVFKTNERIMVGYGVNNKKLTMSYQNGGYFGIDEINFYGRFVLDGDKAYIYEYDDSYYGFSEQQEDEDFIFNNNERVYEWEKMKLYSKDEYGKRPNSVVFRGEQKYITFDNTWKELSNKRPIKVNIDKIFEEKDEDNIISNAILEEIYYTNGSSYNRDGSLSSYSKET